MTTGGKVESWRERKAENRIEDIVGALFDPIIVMPGGWGDDLPDWLRTRVKLERLIENMQAIREGRGLTATDAEAACYLYTASLTQPIGGDWTQIYLYVAGGEMKGETKGELPEDIQVDTLTEDHWRKFKSLKNWIYEQRIKHRQEKARGERREARSTLVAAKKELDTRPVQKSLF